MPNFSILLPPAEDKQPGGNPFAPDMFDYRASNTFNYFSELNPERRRLINTLQDFVRTGADLEAFFKLKGEALKEAIEANTQIFTGPLMSALDRYSPGVMYKAMDFAGLPTGAQRRLLENGIIFSGLFGLLRPDDLIPNYRLRIDASLPEIGSVSEYWRPFVSDVLNRTLEGRVVWNLLPATHQAVWQDEGTYTLMIEPRFLKEIEGELQPATQDVKPIRGQLVNFIVREAAEDLDALQTWENLDGFRLDPDSVAIDGESRKATVSIIQRA
jgi:uncharacterized protein